MLFINNKNLPEIIAQKIMVVILIIMIDYGLLTLLYSWTAGGYECVYTAIRKWDSLPPVDDAHLNMKCMHITRSVTLSFKTVH